MLEKFNGIFYLIIYLVHFIGVGVYAFQTIFGTKPKNGKKSASAFEIFCKTNIPKFTETNIFMAFVNKLGLYENSPGFD